PSIEAVIKVFDTLGNRKNRNKARMKFVIDKLGFAEFKRRWEDAYMAMGHARPDRPPLTLLSHSDSPVPLIMPATLMGRPGENGHGNGHGVSGNGQPVTSDPYEVWKRTNVVPQKQPGYAAAVAKLFMGD